ncbi:MAG: TrgA family protein [Pseudomonadota bacterium]
MPTGSKLIAAIVFGIVAYVAAQQVRPLMPEGTDMGLFAELMGLIGVGCGWLVMGKRAGGGAVFSLSSGLLTSVSIVFWGLLLFSIREMILQSMKRVYDGPTEAIVAVFEIAFDYGKTIADPGIIGTLLVGGFIGGLVTEWASRRYS